MDLETIPYRRRGGTIRFHYGVNPGIVSRRPRDVFGGHDRWFYWGFISDSGGLDKCFSHSLTIIRFYLGMVIKLERDPEKLDPMINPPMMIVAQSPLWDTVACLLWY